MLLIKALTHPRLQLGFLWGGVLLVLSMYVYHATRVIAPLLGIWLIMIWYFKGKRNTWISKIKQDQKVLWLSVVVLILLVTPIFLALQNPQINQRFKETSIFYDLEPIIKSNQAKEMAQNSLFSRLVYHRYLLFGQSLTINFFSHFDLDFLFINGDINPRHSTTFTGLFYYLDFILLAGGIFFLAKTKPKLLLFLVGWLVIGILPSAMSKASPHSLRILPTLPVWMVLITFGLVYLIKLIKESSLLVWPKHHRIVPSVILLGLCSAYLLQILMWGRFYFFVYPNKYQSEWQYGYQQLVTIINQKKQEYPDVPIYVSRSLGRPAMYYWFYSQTDPRQVQALEGTAKKDQGEFLEFNQLKFTSWDQQTIPAMVALSKDDSWEPQKYQFKPLGQVRDLSGQIVWSIYLIEGIK